MPTCRETIKAAMLKLNARDSGVEPSAEELETGLDALQGLYEDWFAGGRFGALRSTLISTNYTAKENERVVLNTQDAVTVTLPQTVDCGWALDYGRCAPDTTNPRPPKDLAVVAIVDPYSGTNANGQLWVYDGLVGAWLRLDALAATDDAPLATRGRDGLACCLALRIADEFGGAQVGALTQRSAGLFESALARKPLRDEPRTAFF